MAQETIAELRQQLWRVQLTTDALGDVVEVLQTIINCIDEILLREEQAQPPEA